MSHRFIKLATLFAFLFTVLIGGLAVTGVEAAKDDKQRKQPFVFDISENMAPLPKGRFAFQAEPVHPDGLPAYGNPFITMGYIYPAGTLDGGKGGVNADGSPEFPEKVIGEWVCRGWFVGDGGKTQSGPMVVTTQIFNFGKEYGETMLVMDGYELADVDKPIKRAITGGTGRYQQARGQATQTLLGLNETQGVMLRLEVTIK